MRKIVLIRLICLLSILISLPISAYDFESGGIYYSIIRNTNEVTVTYGDSHYQGDIVIPEKITYNGIIYSITHIANRAFEDCKELISIVIPNSIMSIGKDAFGGCTGLKSFIIPSSVKSIDECAFVGCSSLASITFPNSLIDIVGGAFDKTPWYENQPDGLVYAGSVAYSYKGEMPVNTNISLMEGTLGIASGAFYGCSGLSSITIPNSVTSIEYSAFKGCSGLTSITIPNSVTSIGSDAFYGCSSLTSIVSEIVSPFRVNCFDDDTYTNATLTVPKGTKAAYQATDGWKNFVNIVENTSNGVVFAIEGINYEGSESDKTALVTSVDVNKTSVTIPKSVTYNGVTYDVTSIADRAFEGRSDLEYLSIPSSITSIGEYAFINCGRNITVNLESLEAWCNVDFYHEHSNPLSSSKALYINNVEIRDLVIPNSVNLIKKFAFFECWPITSITIPSSVRKIDSSAFENCKSLTSVSLPNTLQFIGGSAFESCRGISSVTIPNTVTLIGINAFKNCSGLTNVTSEIQTPFDISDSVFEGIASDAILTVPSGKKSAYLSTAGWKNFANIIETGGSEMTDTKRTIHVDKAGTLPELISIDEKYQIEELTLTGNLDETDFKYIQEMAGDSIVKSLGSWGYARDTNFSSKSQRQPSPEINNYSPKDSPWNVSHLATNGKLKKLDLSKANVVGTWVMSYDIDSNGYWDYYPGPNYIIGGLFNNTHLEEIIIPNSVTVISSDAFRISTLSYIKVGDENTVYDSRNDCNGIIETSSNTLIFGFEKTIIPNSVTSIGISAFRECIGLTSIIIPNSVKSIGSSAFSGCIGLTSITIPNSVKSIGSSAFSGCIGLTSITIPNSVTSIGSDAFYGCSGLTSITIPNSVTSISNAAFSGCSGLTSIKVESGNTKYDSRNSCNAIIETASNTLIRGCNNTIIPSGVTSIGYGAFYGCSSLTSVTIPNSVTSIGSSAFWGCSSLTSVTIPNSVKSIGSFAFSGCSALTSITIPNSVTSIDDSAFKKCSGLTSITIPNSVTAIGGSAFWGCSGLTSVTIPNSVTSIGPYAFSGCSGLTSVTILNSVTSIDNYAFKDCSGLTSITIPNSVISIEGGVFRGCTGLKSIVSEIKSPFAVSYCFDDDIYSKATLTVPKGTKAAYQATEGWKKFVNIVEEGATDETLFTIDGTTYQGSGSNKTAQVKSVDTKLKYLVISASVSYNGTSYQVTGAADNAFSGSTMAALIWDADAALPSNAFSNASIGSNFLLYVKSESYAPSSVKNVVVNGTGQAIVLSDDGGQFYCPQSFTARSILYTHNYSMETGGAGKGWETIVLPFNVQKISHTTRGELIPFASYSSGSNQKPFWLASMASSGFRNSSKIEANTPYIIAMPNNSSYRNDYILVGDVTFSSENVSVPATPTFSGTFVPTYSTVTKSSNVHALNVVNKYVSNSGGYDAGSRFISNLRDIRPFEAYLSVGSSTRGVIEIGFSDGTTGMAEVMAIYDADRLIDIHALNGQKVAQAKQSELDVILDQLPHGVYIVNGKKIVK